MTVNLYVALFLMLMGAGGGTLCAFLALSAKRAAVRHQETLQNERAGRIKEAAATIEARQRQLQERTAQAANEVEQRSKLLADKQLEMEGKLSDLKKKEIEARRSVEALCETARRQQTEHEQTLKQQEAESQRRIDAMREASREEQVREAQALSRQREEQDRAVRDREAELKKQAKELNGRIASYDRLSRENSTLKKDLRNFQIETNKLALDGQLRDKRQAELDERAQELGGRYLQDNVKWIISSVSANNFVALKQRLLDVIERCRKAGLVVPEEKEAELVASLKAEFEKAVRAALEREEQARIKAQIREEQRLQKEVERELQQLERERAAIQAALDKALKDAKDQHSEEVERLKARLAEAEAKAQRAKSQAELTKAGYVYVISNLGAFGKDVFKIGMTRRLEPMDRVRELGDASVPFPFDVHMMISCEDAPSLENAIHRAFHKNRLNKINPRKEFFRAGIEDIRTIVETNHGSVEYVADGEALEYNQSITMTEDDSEFIEKVYREEEDVFPTA